jgi:hypothetical protein
MLDKIAITVVTVLVLAMHAGVVVVLDRTANFTTIVISIVLFALASIGV